MPRNIPPIVSPYFAMCEDYREAHFKTAWSDLVTANPASADTAAAAHSSSPFVHNHSRAL